MHSVGVKRTDLVPFVAPICVKGLRLVTVQLPEKSSPSDRGPTELRLEEFFEVAHRASGSGIMVVVERVKASYATSGLEKGENDA